MVKKVGTLFFGTGASQGINKEPASRLIDLRMGPWLFQYSAQDPTPRSLVMSGWLAGETCFGRGSNSEESMSEYGA